MLDYYVPPAAYHWVVGEIVASLVKIPPAPQAEVLYKDLVCTDEDKALMFELITTIESHAKLQLLFKIVHLKNIGAKLQHVHPLKFLAFIFTHPELKPLMSPISDDYFKWTEFLDGITPNLLRESIKGKLDSYLNDFAKEIGIAPEQIRPYFQSQDWAHFIQFLIRSETASNS
jgi:hypothetical protein